MLPRRALRHAAVVPAVLVLAALLRAAAASPASDLASATVAHLAVGAFDEAASTEEQLARDAPGDAAADALADATLLRLGLGQVAEADADAAQLERTYGRKRPELATRVTLARARRLAGLEDWETLRGLLAQATPILDRRAPLDARLEAHALLGRALARTGKAREAAAEHRRVLALGEKHKVDTRGADAVGEAQFFLGEEKRAEAEQVTLAPYAGPSDRESIVKYINGPVLRWLDRRRYANEVAERLYMRIVGVEQPRPTPPLAWLAGGDPNAPTAPWGRDDTLGPDPLEDLPAPRWAVAAASRVGAMWGAYVYTLAHVTIPRDLHHTAEPYFGQDSYDNPYQRRAKAAFESCLRFAHRHRIADQHTRVCEAWLTLHYRIEYRALDELLPGIAPPPAAGPFAPALR